MKTRSRQNDRCVHKFVECWSETRNGSQAQEPENKNWQKFHLWDHFVYAMTTIIFGSHKISAHLPTLSLKRLKRCFSKSRAFQIKLAKAVDEVAERPKLNLHGLTTTPSSPPLHLLHVWYLTHRLYFILKVYKMHPWSELHVECYDTPTCSCQEHNMPRNFETGTCLSFTQKHK